MRRHFCVAAALVAVLAACPPVDETETDAGSSPGVDAGGGSDAATGADTNTGTDVMTGTDAMTGTDTFTPPTCDNDDPYEDNDAFERATAISAPGTVDGLVACDIYDYFSFTAPANNGVAVEINFLHADADLDLYMYAASDPESSLQGSGGVGNSERVLEPLFDADTPLVIEVKNFGYPTDQADYAMAVTYYEGGYTPCTSDDAYENNDTFDTAAAVSPGNFPDLTACDEDWYSVPVSAGSGLQVDLTFLHADADIDMVISDISAPETGLTFAVSSDDNESACVGPVGADTTLLVKVRNLDFDEERFAPYSMDIALTSAACP